ncbi:hypothetical protein F5Y14DRAFT_147017 [Nemania sp. NC0429]|nr:hypothetical protein F5Y14DRAFT_147017 [Nemania sp. NC0429]
MPGTGMQNVRSQTTDQPVSVANCGSVVGPSHPQYSNKAHPGNEQMVFSHHPAANADTHGLPGNFSNQQPFQYSSHHFDGIYNSNPGVEFQHRLASSTDMYHPYPVFGEPFEYTDVSPATFQSSLSSSAGSSMASERMASMTLEPCPQPDTTMAIDFRTTHHPRSTSLQGHNWGTHCPATISPKMLRINPSPTPTSSSESIHTVIPATCGESDFESSAWDRHQARNHLPLKRSNQKSRKELPTKPARSRLAPTPLHREPVASKGKSKAHAHHHSPHSGLRCLTEPAPPKLAPRDHSVAEAEGLAETVPMGSDDVERDAKNRYLVESKLAGMTYREIRLQGGFTEAESTLRGRFRTLTKSKDQRVRKPEWQEKDIRLLKKAVRKLAKGDSTSAKVPWKQVATYIYEHDGSYHFGNATCRKKWDELVEQGAAGFP